MLAQQCDPEPGEIVWQGGYTYLYLDHAELFEAQMARTSSSAPRLRIQRRPSSISDYRIEDFEVVDYTPQAALLAPVAV